MSSDDILAAANAKVARWKAYLSAEGTMPDGIVGVVHGGSIEHGYAMHEAIDLTMPPSDDRGTFPGLSPFRVLRTSEVLSTLTSVPCITTTSLSSALIGALAATSLLGTRAHVWWVLRHVLHYLAPAPFYTRTHSRSPSTPSTSMSSPAEATGLPMRTTTAETTSTTNHTYYSHNGSCCAASRPSSNALCSLISSIGRGCRLLILDAYSIRLDTLLRLSLCGLCVYVYTKHVLPRCRVTVHPATTTVNCSSSPAGPCRVTDRVLTLTNSQAGTHADSPAHFCASVPVGVPGKEKAAMLSPRAVFDAAHYTGNALVVDVGRALRLKAALSPLTQPLTISPAVVPSNVLVTKSADTDARIHSAPALPMSRARYANAHHHTGENSPGENMGSRAVLPDVLPASRLTASTSAQSSSAASVASSSSRASLSEKDAIHTRNQAEVPASASASATPVYTTATAAGRGGATEAHRNGSTTLLSSVVSNEPNPRAITVSVMQTALQPLLSRTRGEPVSRVWRLICVTRVPQRPAAAAVDGFDPDFAFFLPETIEYLHRIFPNLMLVATDAVSVDGPGVSPIGEYSHGTLLRRGVAILENLYCGDLYGLLRRREQEGNLLTGAMLTVFHPTREFEDARGCSVLFFPRLQY